MSFISKLQIRILNRKTNQNPSSSDENEQILCNTSDVEKAKLYAIKICQAQSFPNTIEKLENKSKIDNKDKLVQLNPFLDQKTVLRARGRLEFASCLKEDARFPIILDAKNAITKMYNEHAHHICVHQ